MRTVETLLKNKSNQAWSIGRSQTVYEAIKLMGDKDIGALPVIENNRLIGIISERDYSRKIKLLNLSSDDTLIENVMTRRVYYTEPNESIDSCMRLMTEKHIGHIPVLKNKELIGMISLGDVVKQVFESQKEKIKELEHYISWEESY